MKEVCPPPSPLEPESKMMIYRVHQTRLLAVSLAIASIMILVILTNPSEKCVQVSVSVQQWQPYQVKRTRFVHGLKESIQTSEHKNSRVTSASRKYQNSIAWFRAKLILPSGINKDKEQEDDDQYEESDYTYENEDYYDDSENKVFERGDFDYNETDISQSENSDFGIITRMFLSYKYNSTVSEPLNVSNSSRTISHVSKNLRKSLKPRNITLINVEGIPIVENGIFWSDELEKRTPKGADDLKAKTVLQKLRSTNVQRVESPTWNRCGRPKNQFVVFEDGSKACARYRAPHQYLVQGEVLSFYLSRLLGITNVPVVTLASVDSNFGGIWNKEDVKENLIASNWEVNTTVALIQWIENLERDKMTPLLLESLMNHKVLSPETSAILKLPVKILSELLQWSDLVVFDYITGNYDRVASMQDAADKESKPSIMYETIHNLVRSKVTGALWLIDNESGLLDSYSLLYGTAGKDGRFLKFHEQMLETICLFRRSTVERIQWLHHSNKAGQILLHLVRLMEPLFPPIKREKEISKRLQERISEVSKHIEKCLLRIS